MRWFGGSEAASVLPDGATLLWDDGRPIWTVGEWRDHEVRTIRQPTRRLAVFGVCAATDTELAQLLAEDEPRDAAYRWAGCYTVICQDSDKTAIYTDLGWACPMYTTRAASGAVFASSARALGALAGWRIDRQWLAAHLLRPRETHLLYGRSPFRDVATTPPACRVVLARTGRMHVQTLWKSATKRSFAEGADALASALTDGIAARVTGAKTVTTDLSGGLDSTSVTLLAALASPSAVHATTLHPATVTHGGDLDAARHAVSANGNISHRCIAIERTALPYTDLYAMPSTDEPAPSTVTFARYRAQLRVLNQLASDCHLTGDGGDAVLTAPLAYLADLVRTRRIRALTLHATGWARLYNQSPTTLLRIASRAAGRHGSRLAVHDLVMWPGDPPTRCLTAESHSLVSELRDASSVLDPADAGDAAAFADVTTIGRRDRADSQLTDHFGVQLHNPFVDGAVIDACLSVPSHERTTPYTAKPLLRAALRGRIPDFVFDRRTKGDFTPDEYLGIRANADTLRAMFTESRLADLGLVEEALIQRIIDRAIAGLPFDMAAFDALVSAETWLAVTATTSRPRWSRIVRAGAP